MEANLYLTFDRGRSNYLRRAVVCPTLELEFLSFFCGAAAGIFADLEMPGFLRMVPIRRVQQYAQTEQKKILRQSQDGNNHHVRVIQVSRQRTIIVRIS
jgi:hypothetical protein